MFLTEPICHTSPPFGCVTVICDTGDMANASSLSSYIEGLEVSVSLTLHCVDGVFGTVQL